MILVVIGIWLLYSEEPTTQERPASAPPSQQLKEKPLPPPVPNRQGSMFSSPIQATETLMNKATTSVEKPGEGIEPDPFTAGSLFKNSKKSLEHLNETSSETLKDAMSMTVHGVEEGGTSGSSSSTKEREPEPSSTDSLFTHDDLNYLEKKGADVERSQRFSPGVRTGGGRRSTQGTTFSVPSGSEEDQEEEEGERVVFYEGQARGYTLLSLMQPTAREAVEAQLETLMDSEVETVYLGVLTDGTFGKNFVYLEEVLRRFHDAGRSIVLGIFLTNGPTMRRYSGTPITAGFNRIEPERFRDLIQFDPDVRARFVSMAEEVAPLVRRVQEWSEDHRVLISVMLEDNLRVDSYTAMRQLAHSVFGDTVSYVRNPCPNCYRGNDVATNGDAIEHHRPEQIPGLTARDGFSLDGVGIRYGTEEDESALTIEEIQVLLDQTLQQGVAYIGLWRKQRQGIYTRSLTHPDQRSYEVMTPAMQDAEINLLRHGLIPTERTLDPSS